MYIILCFCLQLNCYIYYTILNIVSILRLGVAGATRVSLYKTLAVNDKIATSKFIKTTELYLRKVSVFIIFYVFVLSISFPLFVETNFEPEAISLLVIAVGIQTFSQYFFGMTYQTLLDADQRQYVYK